MHDSGAFTPPPHLERPTRDSDLSVLLRRFGGRMYGQRFPVVRTGSPAPWRRVGG